MADSFQRLIQLIESDCPGITGRGSDLWGAKHPGYRDLIRSSIAETLEVPESVRDLKQPPRSQRWSISISHASHFGGWVASPLPLRIGFDVEEGRRISQAVIERMSSPQEIAECPTPAFLWCAKEAYFKALAQDQPQAITQLNIGNWQELGDGFFSFSASPHKPGRGWVLNAMPFMYGICIVS